MQRVAIVEPRSSGVGLIDRAAELGLAAVVVTANCGERTVPARELSRAAEVVVVDTNDDDEVRSLLRQRHVDEPLHAVVPGFEHYVPLAAHIAGDLGLPGLSPETAARLRHKHLMRMAIAAAGLDQPRYVVVQGAAELPAALAHVGQPCVVKPVDQSGSLNVRRVDSLTDAVDAFQRISSGATRYLGRPGLRLALVEEYVPGPEVSVEGYVSDGIPRIVGVTEKVLGPEPWFVEVGHVVPAALAPDDDVAARAYVRSALQALSLHLGPFHAELRMTDRGPLLMEVAARLPGDRIPDLLRLAGGADLYETTLSIFLGQPVAPTAEPQTAAAIRFVVRPELTSHGGLSLPDETREALTEFGTLVPPGRRIPMPGSSSSRIGYAIATAATRDAAVNAVMAADDAVRIAPRTARHVLILNRWANQFGEYHRYLDHTVDRVAYITTPDGVAPLDDTMAEEIVVVDDLADRSAVITAAKDLAERRGSFTDVLALSEFDLELGADIRDQLDVPGKRPEQVRLVRDKVTMKTALAAAGLRVPYFVPVATPDDVRRFADRMGLPVVVKPRDGADSQGVHVLDTAEDLEFLAASVDLTGYQCETFVRGTLYQVDGVVAGGRLRTVRSWRCLGSCLGFATGSPFASVANDDSRFERRIVQFTERVLAALQLTDDVFHLEVFREDDSDDLVFLEIGARAGGGQVRFVWHEVYGLDLVEASVHVQLGIEREYPQADAGATDVAGYLMMPEPPVRPCVVHGVRSLVGQVPWLYAETLPPPGTVLDGNGGAVDTAGTFRFRAPTSTTVEAAIRAAIAAYQLDWTPQAGRG